jgi:lipid II:glycine glycyltransferase (peptidoglycan interpeptide bridge formation enzyme)
MKQKRWKYVEIRPLSSPGEAERKAAFGAAETFAFHMIDLRPDLDALLRSFHKSCVQRKLTKAEKEGLQYTVGRSEELVEAFYKLLLVTRRRHQLPPQPHLWFRNLVRTLGENLQIHMVAKDGKPIATILTLRHKKTLVYKYGCSDSQYNRYGGTILLFWRAIQEGKAWGAEFFDLGRSETTNSGLIEFKGHWGAPLQQIHYYRYPAQSPAADLTGWKMRLIHNACSRLPDPVLQSIGNVLYRHVG